MDKKEIIKKIILEFNPNEIELVERDIKAPLKNNNIISLIGPRRSGKTYLMYQTIKNLIKTGVEKQRIIFINFEDERLLPFLKDDFDLIEEAYFELYPKMKKPLWFFLDEVQNIVFWEKYVRRLSEKGYFVYISGSSSKLLSYEISTSLRGRVLPFFVYPFSFTEFLRYRQFSFDKNSLYSKDRFLLKKFYQEFFNFGGLPQVFSLSDDLKIKYLQEYINLVIYKDIIERYNLKNLGFIKDFAKTLIKETSNLFSITSYYKTLKNLGLNIGKETLFNYLSYLEENNLIFTVPIFSKSKKAQIVNPKKIYIIDQGLYNAISFDQEKGKILETMVFLYFKRKGYEIFYYRNKFEIDLILQKQKEIIPVQVSYSLKDLKTFEREVKGLREFMRKFKVKKGLIVTNEERGEVREKEGEIKIVGWLGLVGS